MTTDVSFDPTAAEPVLRFARHYPHPRTMVWAALTEPAQLRRWFVEARADVRPGGSITFLFPGEEPDTAQITEIEPGRVLAFDWAGDKVRFTLSDDGEGCLLRLTNTVDDAEWAPRTAAGWDRCLADLAAVLAGGEPAATDGPDEALIAHYREALT